MPSLRGNLDTTVVCLMIVTLGLASSSGGTCSCSSWWRMSCGSRFSVRRLGRFDLPCNQPSIQRWDRCADPK